MSNTELELKWESLLENPAMRKKMAALLASQGEDSLNCIAPKVVEVNELKTRYQDQSVFMALLHRQNSIQRWTKSQSIQQESLNDHCASVAYLGLLIGYQHKLLNPAENFSPERLAIFCLFHDSPETLGEDLNGVLKGSDLTLREKIKETEALIAQKMAATIDPVLSPFISPYFLMECSKVEKDLVKAADLLSAFAKSKCELRSNNADYVFAAGQLLGDLQKYMEMYPAVQFVYDHYIKAYELTIDELIMFLPKVEDLETK